jgi:hypothetical protein
MDEWDKESGLVKIPSQHVDPNEMRRVARRLYQRVVLGWRDPQIAKEGNVDVPTVRTTVRNWAKDLGIEVPKLPPGAPKKPIC